MLKTVNSKCINFENLQIIFFNFVLCFFLPCSFINIYSFEHSCSNSIHFNELSLWLTLRSRPGGLLQEDVESNHPNNLQFFSEKMAALGLVQIRLCATNLIADGRLWNYGKLFLIELKVWLNRTPCCFEAWNWNLKMQQNKFNTNLLNLNWFYFLSANNNSLKHILFYPNLGRY